MKLRMSEREKEKKGQGEAREGEERGRRGKVRGERQGRERANNTPGRGSFPAARPSPGKPK